MRSSIWFCRKPLYPLVLILALIISFLPSISTAEESSSDNSEQTLNAIVSVRAQVPPSARLVDVLGTSRDGSGIVIDNNGLVLTIGYLIVEASDVEVTDKENKFVPAKVIAYDYDTGFGLVRAVQPLGIDAISLGQSANLEIGDQTLIISHTGPQFMQTVEVVDVRDFTGFWEYLLEDAIFTSPPFREFAGAALINKNGDLVGVGSLIVSDAIAAAPETPGNMFVPIDQLKPIIEELLEHGRRQGNGRPWLGIYTEMARGHLFITRIADDSPAAHGDLRANDIVVNVNGSKVVDMAGFFRNIWSSGKAGVEIELSILRNGEIFTIILKSEDRYDWLKLNPRSKYISSL